MFLCGIGSHFLSSAYHSPHAVPERLRLRVNRIILQEYESMQFDKERLRDICKLILTFPTIQFTYHNIVLL